MKVLKTIAISLVTICIVACAVFALIMASIQQSFREYPPTVEEIAENPELARYVDND